MRRHERIITAGYDLGIFEEAIRNYAHLHAPIVALKGPGYNILGDHFSPVLVLLAPVYRVFPSPVTLLVAQAALMSLACVPLTRWAHELRGPVAALVVGCGTGASWGIVKAASFDFHEIAFAVPLIAFSVTALGQRRQRAAALWALPLVLVKEDLGLTVAAIGAIIAWQGARRLGIGLAVTGLAATAVEMFLILPAVNPQGSFAYLNQLPGTAAGAGGTTHQLLFALPHLVWPPIKVLLLLMLALPTAFLGLRSPLTLICLPTLAWRLTSDNPHYWGVSYHYSAVLMPIVFAGLVDALDPARRRLPRRRVRAVLVASTVFTVATIPVFPLHEVLMPAVWTTSPHVRAAKQVAALVPDGATVATSDHIAAQLTDRATVSQLCQAADPALPPPPPPGWVLDDSTDHTGTGPCPAGQSGLMVARYESQGYRVVADRDGVILLRHP
ncbi:DUF2079 domain-containing protein [Streptacidiphilus sp. PB12-B1b]|nr:DUF2079 domain-containing protein [Streptacidiphilus sp. PB12-B1b]